MYPDQPSNTKQKTITTFAVIVIAGIIIAAAVAFNNNDQQATQPTASTDQASQSATSDGSQANSSDNAPSSSLSDATYKDGTYTASSDYNVPRSFENIKVTLTVAGGVVTNSQITNSEGDRESAQYQEAFASEYKSYVVGKKLSDIRLSYVAGASDTADGFNEALEQIKNQAQS